MGPTLPGALGFEAEVRDEDCGSNTSIVDFSMSSRSSARAPFTAPRTPPPPPPDEELTSSAAPERVLRSRWSDSTFEGIAAQSAPPPTSSAWRRTSKLLDIFSPHRDKTTPAPSPAPIPALASTPATAPILTTASAPTLVPPSPKKVAVSFSPAGVAPSRFARFNPRQRHSLETNVPPLALPSASAGAESTPDRRDSRELVDSAASGKSLPARKAIPIELFIR
jgi:hypothetical protein